VGRGRGRSKYNEDTSNQFWHSILIFVVFNVVLLVVVDFFLVFFCKVKCS
jgi:hypothetical protein